MLTRRSLCFKCRKHSSGRAGAAMERSHHPGKVSSAFAPECPTLLHALWCALSPAVCLVCAVVRCCALLQRMCPGCQRWKDAANFCRHAQCSACRYQPKTEGKQQPTLDPLAQIGENACQLMATLPTHSHHRAPLLSALSQHIPSSTAATLLHAASSTIRNAKRKDYSDSDLLQQKYPTGVKRQKLAPERVEQLCCNSRPLLLRSLFLFALSFRSFFSLFHFALSFSFSIACLGHRPFVATFLVFACRYLRREPLVRSFLCALVEAYNTTLVSIRSFAQRDYRRVSHS